MITADEGGHGWTVDTLLGRFQRESAGDTKAYTSDSTRTKLLYQLIEEFGT